MTTMVLWCSYKELDTTLWKIWKWLIYQKYQQ